MAEWIVGGLLGWCSIKDIKSKELSLRLLLVTAGSGIIFQVWIGVLPLWQWLAGILLGVIVLGVGFATREAIGYGDGLMIGVIGIWLGVAAGIEILFLGLCISACLSALLLTFKKVNRNYRIPFIPFLFLAWLIWLVATRLGGE